MGPAFLDMIGDCLRGGLNSKPTTVKNLFSKYLVEFSFGAAADCSSCCGLVREFIEELSGSFRQQSAKSDMQQETCNWMMTQSILSCLLTRHTCMKSAIADCRLLPLRSLASALLGRVSDDARHSAQQVCGGGAMLSSPM